MQSTIVFLPRGNLLLVRERYFKGGDTQGDPTALGAYILGVLQLLKFMLEFINLRQINAKEVAFAGNFTAADSLNGIKNCCDELKAIDSKFGHSAKPKKSNLKVKENKLTEPQNLFTNSRINITTDELKKRETRCSYQK